MYTFNIKVGDIKSQFELFYNLYKNSLDDILNSNIDNIIAKIVNITLSCVKARDLNHATMYVIKQ